LGSYLLLLATHRYLKKMVTISDSLVSTGRNCRALKESLMTSRIRPIG
jgi:hypothetical protein